MKLTLQVFIAIIIIYELLLQIGKHITKDLLRHTSSYMG